MRLSEDLRKWRADRPDEWTMDRFIQKATRLEAATALLREVFYARLPVGTRVDDAICEIDTSMYDRVHSFLVVHNTLAENVG